MRRSVRSAATLFLFVLSLSSSLAVEVGAQEKSVTPPVMRSGRQQNDAVAEKYSPHDTFFCHFLVHGVKSGTLTVIWFRDQEQISKASAPIGSRVDWVSSPEPPPEGWKPGKYHVDILVNNKLVRRGWTVVEEKPSAFQRSPQAPLPQAVGRINSVSAAGTVAVKRPGISSWRRAYSFMQLYVGDQIATDDRAQAIIELSLGGTLGLDHHTAIHIVGSNARVADVEGPQALQNVKIMRGSVWSKFKKQHAPFYYTTERSKIKITGTELDCSVGEEDDGSSSSPQTSASPRPAAAAPTESVSLLEGHISYEPLPDAEGSPQPSSSPPAARTEVKMEPGQKVTNDAANVPRVKTYKSDELRKTLDKKHPGMGDAVIKGALNYGLSYAMHTLMQQPALAQAMSNPYLKMGASVVSDIFGKKDEGVPSGLSPDKAEANPNALTFSWRDDNKREKFLVMVSADETFKTVDWSGSTDSTSLAYPADTMPLVPGQKYYWMVVGANAKGKFKGKAAQSYFTVPVSYQPPPTTTIVNDVGSEDGIKKPRDLTKVRIDNTPPRIAQSDADPRISEPSPSPSPSVTPTPRPPKGTPPGKVPPGKLPPGKLPPGKISDNTPPPKKSDPVKPLPPPKKTVPPVATAAGGPAFYIQQRDPITAGANLVMLNGFAWDQHGIKRVTIGGQEAVVAPLQSFDLAAYRKKPNCVKFSLSVSIKPGQDEVAVAVTNIDGKTYEKNLSLQGAVAGPKPSPSPEASPTTVAVDPGVAKGGSGRRFALLIGVSQFDDPNINPLKYPSNDVNALRAALVDPVHGGYPAANIKVLDSKAGDRPTLANIGKAFNWLSRNANRPDDQIFVYISSHGYSDPTSGTAYIVCADTPISSIGTVGLPVADFNDTLKNLPSKQKFVVLDTCHSGGIGRNDKGADALSDTQRERLLGGRVEGDVRALSCDRGQVSWESDDIKHGVFTYVLVKGLGGDADANHDGAITTDELNTYLQAGMIKWSKAHPEVKQTPVFDAQGSGIMIVSGQRK